MSDLNIGIIGCGKQAPKHISGLKKNPGINIWLADIEPGKARQLADETSVNYVNTVDDLFNNPDIIALDICTPTPTHYDLIEKSIISRKHFLCEKPLCESLEEALTLNKILLSTHLVGMVGYIYRFHSIFEIGKDILRHVDKCAESNVLGKIVTAFFRLGGRGSHEAWKHMQKTGGGAINEMLVHMIDLALWYFGPVQKVEVLECNLLQPKRIIRNQAYMVDAEDYILVKLNMQSGIKVYCQSDLITPAFAQYIEIQGENGSFMGSIQSEIPSYVFCKEGRGGYSDGKTQIEVLQRNLFEAQMSLFVNSIESGTPPDRCNIEDSISIMKALKQIKDTVLYYNLYQYKGVSQF